MRIKDPNNVIPGFFLIAILPYLLLGIMTLIYWKYNKFYNKYKLLYFILLFFIMIYVIFATGWIYFMGVVTGYKTGLDSVKIEF